MVGDEGIEVGGTMAADPTDGGGALCDSPVVVDVLVEVEVVTPAPSAPLRTRTAGTVMTVAIVRTAANAMPPSTFLLGMALFLESSALPT